MNLPDGAVFISSENKLCPLPNSSCLAPPSMDSLQEGAKRNKAGLMGLQVIAALTPKYSGVWEVINKPKTDCSQEYMLSLFNIFCPLFIDLFSLTYLYYVYRRIWGFSGRIHVTSLEVYKHFGSSHTIKVGFIFIQWTTLVYTFKC